MSKDKKEGFYNKKRFLHISIIILLVVFASYFMYFQSDIFEPEEEEEPDIEPIVLEEDRQASDVSPGEKSESYLIENGEFTVETGSSSMYDKIEIINKDQTSYSMEIYLGEKDDGNIKSIRDLDPEGNFSHLVVDSEEHIFFSEGVENDLRVEIIEN